MLHVLIVYGVFTAHSALVFWDKHVTEPCPIWNEEEEIEVCLSMERQMLVIFICTAFVQSRNHTEYLSTWKFELPKTKYELTFSFLVFYSSRFIVCLCVFACIYIQHTHTVHPMYAWGPGKPNFEPPQYWVLGIEPGPLEEQPMFSTIEPSLQPRWWAFCFALFYFEC